MNEHGHVTEAPIEQIGDLEVQRISGDIQRHAALSTRSKARKQALDILFEADTMGTDPVTVLALRPTVIDNPVRPFAAELVEGVTTHRAELDAAVSECLAPGWTLRRMPRVDRVLALVGAYEILFTDVPNPTAISEAVELGGEFSTDDTPAFLNGLLTGIAEHGPFEVTSPQTDSQDPDEAVDTATVDPEAQPATNAVDPEAQPATNAVDPETQPDGTTDRTVPGDATDHDPQGSTEPDTTEPVEAAAQPPTGEDVNLAEAADDHPSDPAAE